MSRILDACSEGLKADAVMVVMVVWMGGGGAVDGVRGRLLRCERLPNMMGYRVKLKQIPQTSMNQKSVSPS